MPQPLAGINERFRILGDNIGVRTNQLMLGLKERAIVARQRRSSGPRRTKAPTPFRRRSALYLDRDGNANTVYQDLLNKRSIAVVYGNQLLLPSSPYDQVGDPNQSLNIWREISRNRHAKTRGAMLILPPEHKARRKLLIQDEQTLLNVSLREVTIHLTKDLSRFTRNFGPLNISKANLHLVIEAACKLYLQAGATFLFETDLNKYTHLVLAYLDKVFP